MLAELGLALLWTATEGADLRCWSLLLIRFAGSFGFAADGNPGYGFAGAAIGQQKANSQREEE